NTALRVSKARLRPAPDCQHDRRTAGRAAGRPISRRARGDGRARADGDRDGGRGELRAVCGLSRGARVARPFRALFSTAGGNVASMRETAEQFFEACETGKGWAGCQRYCHPDATFSAQTGALAGVDTLERYT